MTSIKQPDFETISMLNRLQPEDIETLKKLARLVSLPITGGKAPEKKPSILSHVSTIAKYGEIAAESGEKVTHFVGYEVNFDHPDHTHSTEALSSALHLGALGFSALNFIRIPVEYLKAWVTNEPVNFSISKNARWALSAVLLTIGIAVVCFPVIAPGFSIGAAFLGLGAGIIGLANLLYQRMEIQELQAKVQSKIEAQALLINAINKDILSKYHQLESAFEAQNDSEFSKLIQEIQPLLQELDEEKNKMIHLKGHQAYLDRKLHKLNSTAFMDKVVSISLSVLAIIGITVSFLAPPIGFGIIAAVASAGFLYVTGRIGIPLIKRLGSWIAQQFKSTSDATDAKKEALEVNLERVVQPSVESHSEALVQKGGSDSHSMPEIGEHAGLRFFSSAELLSVKTTHPIEHGNTSSPTLH